MSTTNGGEGLDTSGAIEIAPRVWWVGSIRPDDTFQCHSYLLEAGDHSVLIDPGSVRTVDETLRRASTVVPLSSIRWVVCHHSDPDIAAGLSRVRAALPRDDLQVVTEWRAETLLHHYDAGIPFFRVEEHDWVLPLDDDARASLRAHPVPSLPRGDVLLRGGVRVCCSAPTSSVASPTESQLFARDELVLRGDAPLPRALHAEQGDPRRRAEQDAPVPSTRSG